MPKRTAVQAGKRRQYIGQWRITAEKTFRLVSVERIEPILRPWRDLASVLRERRRRGEGKLDKENSTHERETDSASHHNKTSITRAHRINDATWQVEF